MKGEELIRYIQQRPLLLSEDIKYTIMALLNDRLINPSELIDAQYAIKRRGMQKDEDTFWHKRLLDVQVCYLRYDRDI